MSASLELEDPRGIAWSLHVFAGLVAASELPDQAARLWGAADRLLESVSSSVFPPISWIRDRYIETVKRSLGEPGFDEARIEGRAMSLADVIALVHRSTSQPATERE